jgi:hypothetical protein
MRLLLIVAGMLVLAVSASLTPANAVCYFYTGYCRKGMGMSNRMAAIYCACDRQCALACKAGPDTPPNGRYDGRIPPDIVACMATCVAKDAARH